LIPERRKRKDYKSDLMAEPYCSIGHRKMVKDKKGFSLIEVMIVVAIVGFLAAIAIAAYADYAIKAKISEVTTAMDALAQAAVEYHADNHVFPNADSASYADTTAFAAVSKGYAHLTYDSADRKKECTFIAQFTNLNPVNGSTLIMVISVDENKAYTKTYDAHSTLPTKYMPK
jgi:prepilin-type N-terminal cleavage/methylation domain-containing protein